jgi:endonuclease YncB( thermonuclease family)
VSRATTPSGIDAGNPRGSALRFPHGRISLTLLVLLAASPARADYAARVVGISDGDTLTVLTAEEGQVTLRLYGIDAPETGQSFGSRAKQTASALAFGKVVTVRPRDTDRYGRTVAEVILPDCRSLNRPGRDCHN